jgi:PAS domain-containing protein
VTLNCVRASEQRFRDAHEASPQGYALFSAVYDERGAISDFAFDYINPAGAAIAGGVPEDFIGRRLSAVYPAARAALFERLREVALTGNATDFVAQYDAGPAAGCFRSMVVKVGDGVAVAFIALPGTVPGLEERPSAAARSAVTRFY